MNFVTDEIVEAAVCAGLALHDGTTAGYIAGMRAALEAASVLWLAHVRAASEHTADYQMAAAAAEIEKGLTT